MTRPVQPDLEELVQLLAALALRQLDEVGGAHVAVAVLAVPGAEDPEEGLVADLLAQRLERHRAAVVDDLAEQHLRSRERRGRRRPELGISGLRVELIERRLGGRAAVALVVDPLRPGGEALVEPDVGPRGERHRVAEPLVRDLVYDRGGRGDPAVVGLGLALQRVADLGRPVHDAARCLVGIRPVEVLEEGDHLGLGRETLEGEIGIRRRRPGRPRERVDRVVDRRAVGEGALEVGEEGAVGGGRQVGRHRIALAPQPGGLAVARVAAGEGAVGHHRPALGHGDGEVVGGLVEGRVVDRVPAGRALRLVYHERPVLGGHPALDRPVGIGDRLDDALVADRHEEGPALAQLVLGADDQLVVPLTRISGAPRVDGDLRDLQERTQVEVEALQVLCGPSEHERAPREHLRGGVIGDLQPVVTHVVAAVAGELEERVARSGRSLDVPAGGSGGGGRHDGDDGQRGEHQKPAGHGRSFLVESGVRRLRYPFRAQTNRRRSKATRRTCWGGFRRAPGSPRTAPRRRARSR